MSLGSGITPFSMIEAIKPWSLGASNLPCGACNHQHERASVKNGRVEYSPCKVLNISAKDEHGEVQKRLCNCPVRREVV